MSDFLPAKNARLAFEERWNSMEKLLNQALRGACIDNQETIAIPMDDQFYSIPDNHIFASILIQNGYNFCVINKDSGMRCPCLFIDIMNKTINKTIIGIE